jgi:hypothetical protein
MRTKTILAALSVLERVKDLPGEHKVPFELWRDCVHAYSSMTMELIDEQPNIQVKEAA